LRNLTITRSFLRFFSGRRKLRHVAAAVDSSIRDVETLSQTEINSSVCLEVCLR